MGLDIKKESSASSSSSSGRNGKNHDSENSSKQGAKGQDGGGNDEEEEDEEDEESEDVYEVEKVTGHKREKGKLSYFIKWKGYADNENTWEAENSVFCHDLIKAYWDRYEGAGGKKSDLSGRDPKPQQAKRGLVKASGPKTAARSNGSDKSKPLLPEDLPALDQQVPAKAARQRDLDDDVEMESATATKKQKTPKANEADDDEIEQDDEDQGDWEPPKEWKSWEEHVANILTVERSNKKLMVHLEWKNHKETSHNIEEAHEKCPQTLIRFYESHLKFTQA